METGSSVAKDLPLLLLFVLFCWSDVFCFFFLGKIGVISLVPSGLYCLIVPKESQTGWALFCETRSFPPKASKDAWVVFDQSVQEGACDRTTGGPRCPRQFGKSKSEPSSVKQQLDKEKLDDETNMKER